MTPYIKPSTKLTGSELQEIIDIAWNELSPAQQSDILTILTENEIEHEV